MSKRLFPSKGHTMLPYIICHMVCSIDGRIRVNRWSPTYYGVEIKTVISPYAALSREYNAQARMLGQNTVHLDFAREVFEHSNSPAVAEPGTFKGVIDSDRACIILDASGKTQYRENRIGGENVIAVLGEGVSEKYLDHLRSLGISYVFAGADGMDLKRALAFLKNDFGIEKIVHHGGGASNGLLFRAGLLDELSVVIYAGVDGLVGMPTILDCFGKEKDVPVTGQTFELLGVRQLDNGSVWLRYKIHPANEHDGGA